MSTPRTLPRPAGRPRAGVRPVYEEFKPTSEWKEDEDSNILLLIHLPGFQTRDMKVSTEGRNIIRVRGERLVAGNKWSRFQEDFPVPSDCIMTGIRARFDGGILTITIPRKKKQVQETNPSTSTTTIPSQATTENLTSKPQPTPIGGQIRQPTPYKRVDDPTVLDDDDKKLTKESQNTQDEKRPTLDPFRIGKPTPIKRADDEQRVLDEHERETKDNQKLLDDTRLPTLDPFQIRKPTPMKIRAIEKSVLEDREREAKDNEKRLEDKRSPTLDPFQIRKPTPMKIRASEKRVLEDREREAKDHVKLQDERSRPTLDPFQIRKPTPMKRANDEKRVLEDHEPLARDYEKLLEEKRPTLDPFRIKKPTNIDEQSVHEDHERQTKDHQKLLEEHTPTLDPFQIKKPTQRFLDEQETRKTNKQKLPIAIKPIMEKKANNHEHKVDETKYDVLKEESKKRAKGASSSANEDQIMGINNYKKKVRSFLEVNEEKKLLVNMGVAVLVLVALGVQISHTISSTKEPSS